MEIILSYLKMFLISLATGFGLGFGGGLLGRGGLGGGFGGGLQGHSRGFLRGRSRGCGTGAGLRGGFGAGHDGRTGFLRGHEDLKKMSNWNRQNTQKTPEGRATRSTPVILLGTTPAFRRKGQACKLLGRTFGVQTLRGSVRTGAGR